VSLKNNAGMAEKIVLKIPSEIKHLKRVSSRIMDELAAVKIDEHKLFDIKLCVEEAVRNSIVHGNHCDKGLTVIVSYWIDGNKLNIEVEDQGKGFDHLHSPDPTANENIMRNSGRGVYLIKRLMDEVKYNDVGNKVRMTKQI
jgi:serine/threonine-protein kinase RsbW